MLSAKWVLYVHNSDLSWAGGASGAGHIEALVHFDIDGADVCGVVSMVAGGMDLRAFTASCSFALLSFARAPGEASASGRSAGCSWGVPWGRGACVEVRQVRGVGGVVPVAVWGVGLRALGLACISP